MYILVKEDIPIGFAILAAAHASLSGYLTFTKMRPGYDDWPESEIIYDDTTEWLNSSFKSLEASLSISSAIFTFCVISFFITLCLFSKLEILKKLKPNIISDASKRMSVINGFFIK